jgi:hypothetical protein
MARRMLMRGVGTGFLRAARRLESTLRGDDFVRSGNWYRNRTTWRMCLDLNRCLYYSRPSGPALDATVPVRTVLTIIDGVVAGEGEGPLAPSDRPLGAVIASLDPVAADLVGIQLMGFDERLIPKIQEAMDDTHLRVTAVRSREDIEVWEIDAIGCEPRRRALESLCGGECFVAHSGWRGHVERASCAA